MKNLLQILQHSYRIIEFNKFYSLLDGKDITKNKLLSVLTSDNKNSSPNNNSVLLKRNQFLEALRKNSTDIIIINFIDFRILQAGYKTVEADYIFQRISLSKLMFISYFFIKGLLSRRFKYYGTYYLKKEKKHYYLGLHRTEKVSKKTRRYLSPLIPIESFFQKLNELNIKYCILRWFENLPTVQENEDIDLLVDDNDMNKLHQIIEEKPGIIPFDIYSESGMPGSDFRNVPYYSLSLAEKTLNETILYKNIFKVPPPENYFYLMAYHAVFHKGENSGIPSERYKLIPDGNPDHNYLYYLKDIISKTKLNFANFSLEGLHHLLDTKRYSPPLDTQYKLSIENNYLKLYLSDFQKQHKTVTKFEGLTCFVAREKIIKLGLLEELLKYIQKTGFTTLKVKTLEGEFRTNFIKKVRGGNWNRGPWPVDGGLPEVIIVAVDVYPITPEPSDFSSHPGLTNRRIINKNEIRDFINKHLPDEAKWFNGVHSSDNEIQALEYLTLAGIDKDEINSEIIKHKENFITEYPVIKILSRYSKRAKVELIDFNGIRAVKKTFKPNCEYFFSNEKKAYKLFQNIISIPKLLEVGNNYIITSYIENSHILGKRIELKIFKKCLNILRQIYNSGYSLLDFNPENFLIDNKKNIYPIDFEFLYEYKVKPEFLSCYDFIGPPESLDMLIKPNNNIPHGIKQFDALWYNRTGIKYKDLSQLNNFSVKLKSSFRYYKLETGKKMNTIIRSVKRLIKYIYRHLP